MIAQTEDYQGARARVVQDLRIAIRRGSLALGRPLPSERSMSEQFGVSRGTLRSALLELEKEGLLRVSRVNRRRIVGDEPSKDDLLMSKTVALLSLVERDPDRNSGAGWSSQVDIGVSDAVNDSGLHLLRVNPALLTEAVLRKWLAEPPYGIVVSDDVPRSPTRADCIAHFAQAKVPVVIYGEGPVGVDVDRVVPDHDAGAYALVQWLWQQGRQRIVRMWSDANRDLYWLKDRNAGYNRALAELGGTVLPALYLMDVTMEAPGDHAKDMEVRTRLRLGYLAPLLRTVGLIDAIMVENDANVAPVNGVLRLMGLEPGRDVLVVGYDNFWSQHWSQAFDSVGPAATVDKRNRDAGQELVRLLLDRVQGRLPAQAQVRRISPELIILNKPAPSA